MPRIDLQCRVIVRDGVPRLAHLQIDEAAAVEGVEVAGTNLERLVAILQCGLQVADNRAGPAAIVERLGVLGIETDGRSKSSIARRWAPCCA